MIFFIKNWFWNIEDEIPDKSEILGECKIGDSGFSTKCDYNTVLETLKSEARKVGGNAIKITKHKSPDFGSTCHRMTATILKLTNDFEIMEEVNEEFIEASDYAILKIYRYNGLGPLIKYNLHLGDSIIARVRNNFKTTIKINEEKS